MAITALSPLNDPLIPPSLPAADGGHRALAAKIPTEHPKPLENSATSKPLGTM
jgi:hypothetical protein